MKTLQQLVKDVLIHRINKRKNINDIDKQPAVTHSALSVGFRVDTMGLLT